MTPGTAIAYFASPHNKTSSYKMDALLVTRAELSEIVHEAVTVAMHDALPFALRYALLPPYLPESKVREMTGFSTRKLAYMREKGEIPFGLHGRKIVYPTREVCSWLSSLVQHPNSSLV